MINFSVIIPHYNSLDVLTRAVNSVPEKNDIEILIVDNSKTPINPNLFSSRKNVHIYYSEYGKGAGTARNVGIKKAKGKWLLMLDADDFFVQNAFQYLYKHINDNTDIIFFNITSCDSNNIYVPNSRHEEYTKLINTYLTTHDENALRYNWKSPWGKMIKSSLVQTYCILFDEVNAANDVMFSLKTGFYAKKIGADNNIIYCATICDGSLTQTPSLENLTARIEVVCRYNLFLKTHKIPQPQQSIMYYLLCIFKSYGVQPVLRLLLYSIKLRNNPFNGITRWYNTYKDGR